MKKEWEWEELVDTFTLSSVETEFLSGEMHNQLGQAVLLKTFQYLGRFPKKKTDVPASAVEYIAKQLRCEPMLEHGHIPKQAATIFTPLDQIAPFGTHCT